MTLKLQQGGAAIPPLVSYQPVMITGESGAVGATTSAKSSKDEGSSDLTDKDLLKMMEKLVFQLVVWYNISKPETFGIEKQERECFDKGKKSCKAIW